MGLSDLVLIIVVGLGTMWMLGFIVTLFVAAIDNTLGAIDYQNEIASRYNGIDEYRPQ